MPGPGLVVSNDLPLIAKRGSTDPADESVAAANAATRCQPFEAARRGRARLKAAAELLRYYAGIEKREREPNKGLAHKIFRIRWRPHQGRAFDKSR